MVAKEVVTVLTVTGTIFMNQMAKERHVILTVVTAIFADAILSQDYCKRITARTVEARNGMVANHNLR